MHQCVKDGFSILLSEVDTVRLFGDNLNLSRIAEVPQDQRRLHFILNLLVQPNEGTSSANENTDREVSWSQ